MKKSIKKLLTTLIVTFLLIYAAFVIVKQEFTFIEYKQEIENYAKLIEEENLKTEELNNTKSKITSAKYIEEIAREKLGYVLPSEIVFVDASL